MTAVLGAPRSTTAAPRRRPGRYLVGLALAVIVAAVALRLAMLGRQSYWGDEMFSVSESARTLRVMLKVGRTEVHTPFYAVLLLFWMRLGGTHEVWTHLLSTLFAVLAVVVAHRGLRNTGISDPVRWALTVATAASGTSIVYSLETRNYSLVLLGAVGLTAATLEAAGRTVERRPLPWRLLITWLFWGGIAATAHLFGAVLAVGALAVLLGVSAARLPWRTAAVRAAVWLGLTAVACSVQVAWLVIGSMRKGFASGTSWIKAPTGQDVWDLLTSTFSAGGITPHADGFAWTSPAGVAVAGGFVLAAAGTGLLTRRRPAPTADAQDDAQDAQDDAQDVGERHAEGRAAALLLGLAVLVITGAFAVSQVKHLWTLRNMIVVTPALLWGTVCLAAWLARTAPARRLVAAVAVGLFGVGLIPVGIGLSSPYKSDFRGLFEYLISVRAQEPGATFVFWGSSPPRGWQPASDRSPSDPAWATLYDHVLLYPTRTPLATIPAPPRTGTTIVTFYRGVAHTGLDDQVNRMIARFGPDYCRRIPVYGLGVIRCN